MKAPPPAPPASMALPDQPGLVASVAPWKGPANEQSYEQIQMQRWESPVAQGKKGIHTVKNDTVYDAVHDAVHDIS